jgi:hypothetical protein
VVVEYCRHQLEFRMGSDGWSESYYHGGAVPKAEKPVADQLVIERKKFLVSVAQIHHVRISAATPGGRSYRFPVFSGFGGVNSPRDAGVVTSNIGGYGDLGAYRTFQFHGVKDASHIWDDQGAPNVAITPFIQPFLDYLRLNGWKIRHVPAAANDVTLAKITGIAVALGVVTFTVPHGGLDSGDKVIVSGCKGFNVSQFNGTWTVGNPDPVPAGSFLSTTTRGIDPQFFYLAGSGKIRLANPSNYSFQQIASWDDFETVGSRRTGRPTDSHRGRRSR